MPLKNRNQAFYEKKAKRLKALLEMEIEKRHAVVDEAKRAKDHAHEVMTSYLAKIRRQDETLASNGMTIQELQDQVAMQWKQRAEAQSDIERAMKLASKAVAKHNRMVTEHQGMRAAWRQQIDRTATLTVALAEAQQTLRYRLWVGACSFSSRLKAWLSTRTLRIKNRWLIWRLNKARISAMEEAGYIPHKLIKIAQDYWEADQRRIKDGAEWQYSQDAHGEVKAHHSWLRRLKIWCGRA